jgi:anti-sigma factor RsiW
MTDDQTLSTEEAIDQQIVAYLDGELDPTTATQVERRMAEDPRYNARLIQLEKAWNLLDSLGTSDSDESFTHSTMAMVALKAQEDVAAESQSANRQQTLRWIGLAAVALVAAGFTFYFVDQILNRENRELVRDLPVIERLDEYRNIDSVEFLERLQKEGLFAAEVNDAP